MKLFSVPSELKAIATICGANQTVSGYMLASVTQESFHYEPAAQAFRRILGLVRNQGEIPDYATLCSDPSLPETTRKVLNNNSATPLTNKVRAKALLHTLEKYRQVRGLLNMSEEVLRQLEGEKVEIDELLELTADSISNVRSKVDTSKALIHIGKGNNSSDLVKKLLSNTKPDLMPTGFKVWDNVNGGVPYGALFVVAATTSGGKSTLANQLMINLSMQAEDCAIVPLEMTQEEMTARLLSNLSGIPIGKILQHKLTRNEKKKVAASYKNHVNRLKQNDSRYTIFSPEEDMSAEEILMLLKPYKYRVVLIDYVNLLKGVDGDDSVRQLGKVARFCKVFAKNNNMIVILLAQLNDEGKIKYSRAIAEHASLAWIWTMTEETRENGIINVQQLKARNQDPFPFSLRVDFETMRVMDAEEGYSETKHDEESGTPARRKINRKGSEGKDSDDEYLGDINGD